MGSSIEFFSGQDASAAAGETLTLRLRERGFHLCVAYPLAGEHPSGWHWHARAGLVYSPADSLEARSCD